MAQWGKTDTNTDSVLWAVSQLNEAPTATNRNALYNNTTPDAYIAGTTIGQYGVDAAEAQANGDVPHAGWVLRTVGTGGRLNRVQYEVLVAMGSMTGDGTDDTVLPDYAIVIDSAQPADASADTGTGTSFTVDNTVTLPAGSEGNLSYEWFLVGTGTLVPDAGVYTGAATDTLNISDVTGLDQSQYYCVVTSSDTGVVAQTSRTATLTETTP